MSTWIIGDIQGCLKPLERLLDTIDFDPGRDRVWFCGDLVNRGGDSLDVLRLVYQLGESAEVVLGNHDLHLLAADAGFAKDPDNAEFQRIFEAADGHELITWLRHRPLALLDREHEVLLVHAGIHPQWSVTQALNRARELEGVLRSDEHPEFFRGMYGDEPAAWDPALEGQSRYRFITNVLTRIRYVDADGRLSLKDKGPPGSQSPGLYPWFEAPGRNDWEGTVVFGHWSTLGLHRGDDVIGVDTGCVWGGTLTALDLDDPAHPVQVPGRQVPK